LWCCGTPEATGHDVAGGPLSISGPARRGGGKARRSQRPCVRFGRSRRSAVRLRHRLPLDFEPGRPLPDLTGLWLDLETVLGCRVAPSPAVDSSRAWRPKRCVTRFDYENGRLRRLDAAGQVELISRFSRRGRAAFFRDVPVRSAALHRRALLGEACRGLSPPLREAHPEVPWPQIAAFRNVAIHGYFGIDYGYRRAGCYRLDVMRPSKRPSQL